MDRAYSLLEIKSIDDDLRVIEGIASTPEVDRGGDAMDPKGATFKLPMPLLLQHKEVVGEVFAADVTAAGIRIKARFAKLTEPETLKNRLDEAWALVKARLVRGFSIGWNPLEPPTFKAGVAFFSKWEWLETSVVTIPMNRSTVIQTVKQLKSFDSHVPAASGTGRAVRSFPGVSGSRNESMSMNVSEQIVEKRTLLQEKSARMTELIGDDAAGGGLSAEDQKELETISGEVETLTKSIARLEVLEKAQLTQAVGVTGVPVQGRVVTPMPSNIQVKTLAKGSLFTRIAMAVAAGRGSLADSIEYAKQFSGTPEVLAYIKAGFYRKADPGMATLESPGWGSQLVNPNTIATEFIELLMPRTIIGRVTGFDEVPFNIPIIEQTGGSTFQWVGEGAAKPVGELAFDRTTLGFSKVAGIVVLTDELIRLSTPKAEDKVRADMIKQCAKFLDEQFIRVAVTAGPSNPASITNGVASPSATGTTAAALRHDLNIALAEFDTANENDGSDASLVIVMTPALARGISLLTTSLGVAEFPGMTPQGGTLLGYTVIVSSSVDSGTIVIFKPSEIFLADDGRVTLDASREATLDMNGGSPTSPTFNLWQNNCTGLRAERWIRWQKKRSTGVVAIIDTAAYAPA